MKAASFSVLSLLTLAAAQNSTSTESPQSTEAPFNLFSHLLSDLFPHKWSSSTQTVLSSSFSLQPVPSDANPTNEAATSSVDVETTLVLPSEDDVPTAVPTSTSASSSSSAADVIPPTPSSEQAEPAFSSEVPSNTPAVIASDPATPASAAPTVETAPTAEQSQDNAPTFSSANEIPTIRSEPVVSTDQPETNKGVQSTAETGDSPTVGSPSSSALSSVQIPPAPTTNVPGGSAGLTSSAQVDTTIVQSSSDVPSTVAPLSSRSAELSSVAAPPVDPTSAGTSEIPVPSSEVPAPTSEGPVPSSEVPAPSSEGPAPSSEVPAPSSEVPAPSSEGPAPSSKVPAPTSEVPAPSSEIPAPSSKVPAPTSEGPAPSSEVPAPTSEVPAPTSEVPVASSAAPTTGQANPSSQIIVSSEAPASPAAPTTASSAIAVPTTGQANPSSQIIVSSEAPDSPAAPTTASSAINVPTFGTSSQVSLAPESSRPNAESSLVPAEPTPVPVPTTTADSSAESVTSDWIWSTLGTAQSSLLPEISSAPEPSTGSALLPFIPTTSSATEPSSIQGSVAASESLETPSARTTSEVPLVGSTEIVSNSDPASPTTAVAPTPTIEATPTGTDAVASTTQAPTSAGTDSPSSQANWLPTTLLTMAPTRTFDSSDSDFPTETGTGTATQSTMLPRFIAPSALPSLGSHRESFTVGFKYPLNYPFLVNNSLAAAQVFEYLPKGLAYGVDRDESEFSMYSITPYQRPGYLASMAIVYVPRNVVDALRAALNNTDDKIYQNPHGTTNTLMGLIDRDIPWDADSGDSTPGSSSDSRSGGTAEAGYNGSLDSSEQPKMQKSASGRTAGIACGTVAGALAFGTLLLAVTRRYRKRVALDGDHFDDNSSYHDESETNTMASRGSIQSILPQQGGNYGFEQTHAQPHQGPAISQPVMSENSLGWL